MSEDTRDVLWSTCVLQTILFIWSKYQWNSPLLLSKTRGLEVRNFELTQNNREFTRYHESSSGMALLDVFVIFHIALITVGKAILLLFNKIIIKLWSTVKSFNSRSELIQIKCNLVLECAINVVWMVLFLFWSLLPEGRLQSLKNLVDDREISK